MLLAHEPLAAAPEIVGVEHPVLEHVLDVIKGKSPSEAVGVFLAREHAPVERERHRGRCGVVAAELAVGGLWRRIARVVDLIARLVAIAAGELVAARPKVLAELEFLVRARIACDAVERVVADPGRPPAFAACED
jgi:hypothetical protein